jgi:hypothetical protein
MKCFIAICSRSAVVISLILALVTNARSCQPPPSRNGQDEAESLFALGFDDPVLLEFAGIKQDQIDKIEAVRQEWRTEFQGLAKEKASRKTIGRAYARRRMSCDAVLEKEQLRLCRRYDLFTNEGPGELVLLERTFAVGEPEFDADQLSSFLEIKKSWIKWADERFKFKPTGTFDKAKRDEAVAAVAKLKGEYREKVRTDLFQVLSESQKERFEQIELQSLVTNNGVRAFAAEDIADELKLTATQKSALKEMLNSIDKETVKYIAVTLQFDGYKTFFDSLSDDQKTIWREKLGEPFSVNNLRWFREFMEADLKSVGQRQN